jgi:hypothetical protein
LAISIEDAHLGDGGGAYNPPAAVVDGEHKDDSLPYRLYAYLLDIFEVYI